MNQRCIICQQTKAGDEFYASSKSTCKPCYRERVRQRRRNNPEVQRYDRERAKLPHRRANSKRILERWLAENPARRSAEVAICNAVRDGRLDREPCDRCGTSKHVFGIAQNLDKPLARILWRCATCYHRSRFEAAPAMEAHV